MKTLLLCCKLGIEGILFYNNGVVDDGKIFVMIFGYK